MNKFKLLFFGSDNFSVRVVKRLCEKNVIPAGVVTGSGSLLERYSSQNNVKIHRWPSNGSPKMSKEERNNYNIGLVASFGHLIDTETVKSFKHGLFNLHPSLLPQFRGSSPVQAAILNDLKETGCTIMEIPPVEKFDIGNVILQERLPITKGEYAFELSCRLADLGAKMTVEFLNNYDICLEKSKPQSNEGKSYARKIKSEQGQINFRTEPANLIDSKIRAYTGTVELYTLILGRKVRLEGMRDPQEIESYNFERALNIHYRSLGISFQLMEEAPPGTLFYHKPRHVFGIKASDGRWIAFDFITPESKPKMTSLEFYNGYLSTDMETQLLRTDV